jgi:hypothetical protein
MHESRCTTTRHPKTNAKRAIQGPSLDRFHSTRAQRPERRRRIERTTLQELITGRTGIPNGLRELSGMATTPRWTCRKSFVQLAVRMDRSMTRAVTASAPTGR